MLCGSQINWVATGQMLTGLGTWAGAAALLIAAIIGRSAASDFREQKVEARKIEHAEAALSAAYRIRDALHVIRSPLSTGAENADARQEMEKFDWFKNKDDEEQSRIVQANVFYQRIRRYDDDFQSAIEMLPFLKAYFGDVEEGALRDLIRARNAVRIYAESFAQRVYSDRDIQLKIESYIWEGAMPGQEDPIALRVSNSIVILEKSLLPIVRNVKENAAVK